MAGRSGASLNWGGFDRAINNAARSLGNTKLLMETIGETLVSGTTRRFVEEKDPQGNPWKKSGRATEQSGQTLSDTGRLRKSVTYAASANKVVVGTNLKYARIHQFGGTIKAKNGKSLKFKGRGGEDVFVKAVNIPARPYIGVSADDMKEVRETIKEFIAGAFD
ncbi:MAG: phage virion morphogenesis protein [Desulfovibrio sp.]|nr:phage virion morphogenesis protein [Desulfovibrio sp.]